MGITMSLVNVISTVFIFISFTVRFARPRDYGYSLRNVPLLVLFIAIVISLVATGIVSGALLIIFTFFTPMLTTDVQPLDYWLVLKLVEIIYLWISFAIFVNNVLVGFDSNGNSKFGRSHHVFVKSFIDAIIVEAIIIALTEYKIVYLFFSYYVLNTIP